jgi:hypothetical protein
MVREKGGHGFCVRGYTDLHQQKPSQSFPFVGPFWNERCGQSCTANGDEMKKKG